MLRLFPSAVVAASFLTVAFFATAAYAQPAVVGADQRSELALTIYQGGFALVHDVRRANLLEGSGTVVLSDLSDRLDIGTVRVAGEDIQINSFTFDRDVLSSDALLRRSVGETVRVVRVNPVTGAETFEDAEVLAVAPELVLRIGDRIETAFPGRIVFDAVPADLRTAPGIVANLAAPSAGERALSLSYLTDGVGWKTSYVGRLTAGGDRMELVAWALVDNQTNTAYPAAKLSLIAGQVNRAVVQPVPREFSARALQAEAVADGVSLSAAGPYYQYALPRTFDIQPRQQTQVELFRGDAVPVVRLLRTEGAPIYSAGPAARSQPVTVRLTLANEARNGLGVPMPAGLFSAFAEADGREIFQGGATVGAVPVGGEMAVDIGQAFDMTFERTVLAFDRRGSRGETVDTTQQLKLRNSGDRPAQVEIVEAFRGEWQIIRETARHEQVSAFQATWRVTVPAGGEAIVEYRAQINQR